MLIQTSRLRPWNPNGPQQLTKEQYREFLNSLSQEERTNLHNDWLSWAREDQLIPEGDWGIWLVCAGRGFGKTRIGAEWTREQAREFEFVNLIGATADDARDVMVEGESGILAVCSNDERPKYIPSKRKLEWPNGAKSLIFTADEPDRARGKQHQKIWGDELAAWRYAEAAFDQVMLGLRLKPNPQALFTTTPRPIPVIKKLVVDSKKTEDEVTESDFIVAITRGATYANAANLDPKFIGKLLKKYEGTRLGRQELQAEILEDNPNALWKHDIIDALRVGNAPQMKRIVVAIDPQVGLDGAETGIIIFGLGNDDHGYVLQDASINGTPSEWGLAAVLAFDKFKADRIIAETNQGGLMVEHVLRTIRKNIPFSAVHASQGKRTRAEPIAALYEQGLIHHVGCFPKLEDQLCEWEPGQESPDRLDSLVWGAQIMVGDNRSRIGVGF